MSAFKERLRGGSFMTHPNVHPKAPTRAVLPKAEYEIERDGDDIILVLGLVPPFRVPVNIAIKLALLILRKCDVEVSNG